MFKGEIRKFDCTVSEKKKEKTALYPMDSVQIVQIDQAQRREPLSEDRAQNPFNQHCGLKTLETQQTTESACASKSDNKNIYFEMYLLNYSFMCVRDLRVAQTRCLIEERKEKIMRHLLPSRIGLNLINIIQYITFFGGGGWWGDIIVATQI